MMYGLYSFYRQRGLSCLLAVLMTGVLIFGILNGIIAAKMLSRLSLH